MAGFLLSVICVGVFAFFVEIDPVREGLRNVDRELTRDLHSRATPASTEAYQLLAFVGSPGVLLMGIVGGIVLLWKKQWFNFAVWSITLLGGMALNNLLKLLFARPRPDFIEPLIDVRYYSFPSGHAMMTFIGVGLLTCFLWKRLEQFYARVFFVFVGSLLVLLTGISRMALGVHYLTDVLAGFAAGGIWLTTCILVARRFSARRSPAQEQKKSKAPDD